MESAEKEKCCLFCKTKFEDVLKTSAELLRTMILSCKRFEKDHENNSQINQKMLTHNLQTVKG